MSEFSYENSSYFKVFVDKKLPFSTFGKALPLTEKYNSLA
jgi:hypothetical protein